VPHVEQELLILPEHPSCWTIKKLCSFSLTFPENSRHILSYWKELSTQQLLSLFMKKNLSNKDQDIFLLMPKTNKKKV
jgi:hypothetical protein